MENASKALIIAGAILLAILIIGLGMMVFSGVQKNMNTKQIDEMAVQTYNNQYKAYFGNDKSGSEVRALLDIISAHNNTEKDASLKMYITTTGFSTNYTFKNTNAAITGVRGLIQAGKTYTVKESAATAAGKTAYDPNTGYLRHIVITQN